jgi:hypothetical protein
MRCYKAGEEARDLGWSVIDVQNWMEYRGGDSVRTGLQAIARHASSLSSVLTGEGRKVAQDLSKYAKELKETVKKRGTVPKKKIESLEKKIFAIKDQAYWLSVSAKAQCGDAVSKGSLIKFRPKKLEK